jgi:hypothetical protein
VTYIAKLKARGSTLPFKLALQDECGTIRKNTDVKVGNQRRRLCWLDAWLLYRYDLV